MASAVRRSAEEWARVVREWKRSGQTAAKFAAPHGIAPQTLVWWRWRLARVERKAKPAKRSVDLIPVRVVESDGPPRARQPSWELCAADGRVLRVFDGGREELGIVVAALLGGWSKR